MEGVLRGGPARSGNAVRCIGPFVLPPLAGAITCRRASAVPGSIRGVLMPSSGSAHHLPDVLAARRARCGAGFGRPCGGWRNCSPSWVSACAGIGISTAIGRPKKAPGHICRGPKYARLGGFGAECRRMWVRGCRRCTRATGRGWLLGSSTSSPVCKPPSCAFNDCSGAGRSNSRVTAPSLLRVLNGRTRFR